MQPPPECDDGDVRVVAAIDKFRGTATAADAGRGRRAAARPTPAGSATRVPMADGGEGTLDALGGANRRTTVMGSARRPVDAEWRLTRRTAVIEMARASGSGARRAARRATTPMAASTHGTGELIAAALEAGASRVIVGVGGSATTDGGLGALASDLPAGAASGRRDVGRLRRAHPVRRRG